MDMFLCNNHKVLCTLGVLIMCISWREKKSMIFVKLLVPGTMSCEFFLPTDSLTLIMMHPYLSKIFLQSLSISLYMWMISSCRRQCGCFLDVSYNFFHRFSLEICGFLHFFWVLKLYVIRSPSFSIFIGSSYQNQIKMSDSKAVKIHMHTKRDSKSTQALYFIFILFSKYCYWQSSITTW